ncbi:G patch domain-containing protein 4 [Trachemys scripta elegans]|uniref:G patch domain-containing protein 4 n=1 Tax=Trachemys scripta elegans TaxID=31138 RepID=UPI00155225E3|nr:G patch domain-containing protein 4 [Trachemys scripta elegans]XP_034612448.1 G patch domain-containing protein 4 [Trachemys scripta elegans]
MNGSPKNKTGGMTFAEQQLQRHGWKQGKGLGKRENGISEAIKVKVKCDTAGVGHDPAEQFTFHWWDHLFNKSAANILVEAGQDGVQMKKLSEQDGEISNKKPRKAPSARSMLYGRFVKAATLTAGGEEPTKQVSTSESSEDEEEKLDLSSVRKLTDEELVRACGGRTAHKGARHGLTMSAKLARLEEQERAFLAKYSQKEEQRGGAPERQQEAVAGASAPESSNPAERRQKAKKKKRKRSKERGGCAEEEERRARKRRKKKKKEKGEAAERLESELPDSGEQPEGRTDQDSPRERAKKKKKRKGQ